MELVIGAVMLIGILLLVKLNRKKKWLEEPGDDFY